MLVKNFVKGQPTFLLQQLARHSFASTQVSQIKQEKDYYAILNIKSTATPEQIKDAYRAMVKKYHPDMRLDEKGEYEPSVEKFRDVAEAYSVLSTKESRVVYDINRRKNPDLYSEQGVQKLREMEEMRNKRDKSGSLPGQLIKRGSYAEERLEDLRKARAKYNVNDLGYYRGGVPQNKKGAIRGTATNNPGEFHSPGFHNYLENYHQTTYQVTPDKSLGFKHWMKQDKIDFEKSQPYYPMHYDREHNYLKERQFWLFMLIGILGGSYIYKKFLVEQKRWLQYDRMENLRDMPSFYFSNRGGVIMQKQFIGFEKYYKTGDDVTNWYKKAYPKNFKNSEDSEE